MDKSQRDHKYICLLIELIHKKVLNLLLNLYTRRRCLNSENVSATELAPEACDLTETEIRIPCLLFLSLLNKLDNMII